MLAKTITFTIEELSVLQDALKRRVEITKHNYKDSSEQSPYLPILERLLTRIKEQA